MDIKQAIDELKELQDDCIHEEGYQALKLAIETLEKQIPKKTEHRHQANGKAEHWVCPACNRIRWYKVYIEHYCGSCGQKLIND